MFLSGARLGADQLQKFAYHYTIVFRRGKSRIEIHPKLPRPLAKYSFFRYTDFVETVRIHHHTIGNPPKGGISMERSENQAARRPTRHNWMKALFCWQFFPHILGILIVLLLAAAVTLGAKNILSADGKTTALGFEDIG